jgi:acyl carrier protein
VILDRLPVFDKGEGMTREQVIDKIRDVLVDTFDDEDIVYREDLTARDVDGWDSLSNIRFMVAVEQAFGRKMTIGEWQSLDTVGGLVDILANTSR